MQLFKKLNIQPHLVFINLAGDGFLSTSEIDERMKNFVRLLNDSTVKVEDITIYADYTVENGVFNYAAKMDADLIALPTHGRRGMAHFFSGSIGEDIVNHSKLPVLTVKI
jgi:nucleotide-binding universal stress UspA family protein